MTLSPHQIRDLLGHSALRELTGTASGLLEDLSRLSVDRVQAHGDFSRFSHAIREAHSPVTRANPNALVATLSELGPWRKGPFEVLCARIDAEWNSTLKWERLRAMGLGFEGETVLDIGSGNGFYARQLETAGAKLIVAVEQSVLYAAQFMALQGLTPLQRSALLVLRAEQVPEGFPRFDTVLSMGVLYHVRSPIDHLTRLRGHLGVGGRLVVETLALEGDSHHSLTPLDRYANMRNVWFIPTVPTLENWLRRTGFRLGEFSPLTRTTPLEQRSTPLAPGPSLAEALDPDDADQTREGYPAPRRVIAVAEAI